LSVDAEGILEALKAGLSLGGSAALRGRVRRGRFPEESNVEARVEVGGCSEPLFHLKVFRGRPPYYRAWVEIHNVASRACGVSFDGLVEDLLLDLLASRMGPAGRLYIEYEWDPATSRELELGIPPPITRLGYKLLTRGFTWFKDWYYPEGFMEGGRKLEAEKPLTPEHARRHLEEIARDVLELMERGIPEGLGHVKARAQGILVLLKAGGKGG